MISRSRRALIAIGEDMVNVAYDADVEQTPKTQIEDTEKRLFELAEKGSFGLRLRELRYRALHRHRHGLQRLPARRPPLRHGDRPSPTSIASWAACRRPT